jgi:hypothetical protein
MLYTLAGAVSATGLEASTILAAIRDRQITGNRDLFGEWHVERDELERLSSSIRKADGTTDATSSSTGSNKPTLEAEIGALIEEAGDSLRDQCNNGLSGANAGSDHSGTSQPLLAYTKPAGLGSAVSPSPKCSLEHNIRLDDRDKITPSISPTLTQATRAVTIAGILLMTLALGWIGGWSSHHLLWQSGSVVQKGNPSAPTFGPETQTAPPQKEDRHLVQTAAKIGKIASKPGRFSHRRDSTQSIAQASAPTKSDTIDDRVRPIGPIPETRPTTVEGWTLRQVVKGVAELEGPDGVWKAAPGDVVPGLGRVESIVLWGSRWIVATSRGLITTE